MSAFTFRPAVRENVPLIVGVIGGTGSGKTFSALELATGLAGNRRFAVIDTEAGRAKHYADHFQFDHGDLAPPFRPQHYLDAIVAADKAGYPVVVVDSTSHVWAGDGGCLDWHEEELQRMAGDDWKKRDACNMAAWIKPKMEHKKMVQRLLQLRAHLILCFRAEPKVEMTKEDGKWKITPKVTKTGKDGWVPVCEKNLPFELTMSFLLLDEHPGVPHPIKLEKDHRAMVPLDQPLDRRFGAELAKWAAGATVSAPREAPEPARAGAASPMSAASPSSDADPFITPDEVATLETMCQDAGISLADLRAAAQVERLASMPKTDYQRAVKWINSPARKRA